MYEGVESISDHAIGLGGHVLVAQRGDDTLPVVILLKPPPWVSGDEVYGADPGLRAWLEQTGTGYVLGIAKTSPIAFTRAGTARADEALKTLIASD
ncbi:MAG TPA: hypothetical protein VFU43_06385 [Streptosporangiaceae bacterium]|nr:hypothetical protein [Streptosporangiaceae bacterium]